MKLRKTEKITAIIVTAIIILLIFMPRVQANNIQWTFAQPQIPSIIMQAIGAILALIRNVCIVATVICIAILGVRYMYGSIEEKTEYKKDYVDIILGVLLISGGFTIMHALFSLAEGLFV